MSDSKIYIDPSTLSANVYTQNDKGVYYVKVSIPSLNMYINSFQVKDSPNYPEKGLWVQWPSFKVGARWIKPIEFRGDSQLKNLVEDEVLRAVDSYRPDMVVDNIDDPINLDDIPFST